MFPSVGDKYFHVSKSKFYFGILNNTHQFYINHTGISVGDTVHLKKRMLSARKRSQLYRYIGKVVCANVTLKYR